VAKEILVVVRSGHLEGHAQTDHRLRSPMGPRRSGHELYYRTANFAPTIANPSAEACWEQWLTRGTVPGVATARYEDIPVRVGPRLGLAYQVTPKTVLRADGSYYGNTPTFNYITNQAIVGVGYNTLTFTPTSFGAPVTTLRTGLQYSTRH